MLLHLDYVKFVTICYFILIT